MNAVDVLRVVPELKDLGAGVFKQVFFVEQLPEELRFGEDWLIPATEAGLIVQQGDEIVLSFENGRAVYSIAPGERSQYRGELLSWEPKSW